MTVELGRPPETVIGDRAKRPTTDDGHGRAPAKFLVNPEIFSE
jgi:hypothetical protein